MTRSDLRGVVALDGPSGTGKSTVARRLAGKLDAGYLDTGAMYRAVTLAVLRAGVELTDVAAVTLTSARVRLTMGINPTQPKVLLNDVDVSTEIRGRDVTSAVSTVSAIADIRQLLIAEQRRIIGYVLDTLGGIVVEGRDIGTVVAPDAGLKVFLTAPAEVRARRRSRQDNAAGRVSTVDKTRADVERRDSLDTKTTPLRPAPDAIELDTSKLDAWGVVNTLLSIVDERGLRAGATETR